MHNNVHHPVQEGGSFGGQSGGEWVAKKSPMMPGAILFGIGGVSLIAMAEKWEEQ